MSESLSYNKFEWTALRQDNQAVAEVLHLDVALAALLHHFGADGASLGVANFHILPGGLSLPLLSVHGWVVLVESEK